ncbi:MFS transporter [Amycolatopsis sp. M39]|nr:MFS transporter [Amycolatopsis sp. M39]
MNSTGPARAARVGAAGTLAVLLAVFVIMLDTTVVNLAVPDIRRDLRTTGAGGQWTVNAYNVAIAAVLLSAGALADRLGPRRVFAAGLAVFALASAACALSPTAAALIGARVLQGLGGAAVMASGLALVAALHPADAARTRALAWWAAVVGAGTVLGPCGGGLLLESLGWRAVFWLNIPFAAVALAVLAIRVPPVPGRARPLDPAGQVAAAAVLTATAFAATAAGNRDWSADFVVAVGAAGLGLAALVVTERRARAPMLPPQLLGARAFLAPILLGGLLSFGVYGGLFVLSAYFQLSRGLPVAAAGLAILPFAAAAALAAPLAARLAGRCDARQVLAAGLISLAAGAGLVAACASCPQWWPVATAEALLGIGHALLQPALTAAALRAAGRTRTGTGSGVLAATRQTGSVLGVALLGGLVADPAAAGRGTGAAFAVIATMFAAATLLHLAVAGRPVRQRSSPTTKEDNS